MALISDATLGRIVDEMERRNAIIAGMSEMFGFNTWELVQFDVRNGNASKYAIGSELVTKYTDYQGNTFDFPWIVVDNDRKCTWPDGTQHPGLWLMAKYTTHENMAFDEQEGVEATEATAQEGYTYCGVTGTTYTDLHLSTGDTIPYSSYTTILKDAVPIACNGVCRDGYNRYRDCVIRQWLNSDGDKGEWWEATHVGDNQPSGHNGVQGFIRCLEPEFAAIINPVKIKSIVDESISGGGTDITYDRFFLPSVEEVYGVPQIADVEGPYFPYWKTKTELNAPSNDENANRIIYRVDNHATVSYFKLRTCSRYTAYNVWGLGSTGNISNNVARHSWYVCPCCVIS